MRIHQSPTGSKVKTIADYIFGKADDNQTSNIVVNLKSSTASVRNLVDFIRENAPNMSDKLKTVPIYDQSRKLFQMNLR